jgi:hypothetical protein
MLNLLCILVFIAKMGGKKSVGVLNINEDNFVVRTMLITSGT